MRLYTGSKIQTLALRREEVAVTVYDCTRQYGGPEEGGWWYTYTEAVCVAVFRSLRKARIYLREQESLSHVASQRRRRDYYAYNDACLAHAERYGLDPDTVGSLDFPMRGFVQMESPAMLLSEQTQEIPHYC